MTVGEKPEEFILTPRQADCINLVGRGLTSKQIARQLGISPRTVDQHIAAVIEILQVNNRMAAVTRLREIADEHEGYGQTYMPNATSDLADFSAAFLRPKIEPASSASFRRPPIFPHLGGRINDASARQRLIWVSRIAFAAVMLSCVVLLTIMGLSDLARFAGM